MTSIQNLIVRRALLSKTIAEYEQLIQTAPEGDLIARKQPAGNYSYTRKIHLPDGRIKEIYLGRAASDEVTALAQKRCALKALPSLKQEYKLLDKLIALRMKDSECDLFLKDHPAICSLLHLSTEEELLAWKNAPYNRNMKYPDQLRFTTVVPDLLVRSKSEADILSRMEFFGVPYHYEEIQIINNVPVAIDFTCKNISTKQTLYWDHKGLLDNPAYIQKTLKCDALFLDAGIIPWKNLIVTTETKDFPLDIQWVDIIIQHFLL